MMQQYISENNYWKGNMRYIYKKKNINRSITCLVAFQFKVFKGFNRKVDILAFIVLHNFKN